MSKKKVVVALGHEALGSTIVEQLDAVKIQQKHWQTWLKQITSLPLPTAMVPRSA